ncbi:MAG: RNA-binding S4 domain-containing protein, partial [Clostridia bacterium]|nr:RNA-binding S4 domain-containing protein [Clostridia bacterium]
MRLDKYLKVSRIIKRRTVANEACDQGRVTVNGNVAKASYEVKVGDVLELRFGERVMRARIVRVSEHAGKG